MQADQLAADFGIDGVLGFQTTADGLVKAAINCDGVAAELFLQGAQLTQWTPPGARPVLFTSARSAFAPGKAIRGGIPVIFPWFGPHPSEAAAPQHGFARTMPWRLDGVEQRPAVGLTMHLVLEPQAAVARWWDKPVRLAYSLTVGPRLHLELMAENSSGEDIVFEEALHTYFAVSEVTEAAVSGLQGCRFIDKTDKLSRKRQDEAPLMLDGETDRVYLDTPDRLDLTDPGWRRRIDIVKEGAHSTIVWNPWQEKAQAMADLGEDGWRSMICVETGNAADNAVRLMPGARHRMAVSIEVAAIS